MPWSGGAFTRTNGVNTGSTLWVQDRDDGTKILATRHDTNDQDMADGISSTLEKSGSNAATGNLNIGSNRLTAVADGTAKTDAATVNQIVSNAPAFQATDTGTANAHVIALSPAITAYAAGQEITFKSGAASTGASTLNVNTVGVKAIKKLHDQDIAAGDIESGSIVTAVYDGTNFQMTSQVASAVVITPGGSNTQVQYNSSGSFAGSANFTFDGTNIDVSGDVTGATLNADGDTSASDNAAIGYTSAEGLILTGQGSNNDITIKNDADEDVITIATGTTATTFAGDVTIAGATPTLTIGDAGAEDTKIVFDGNAQDYYMGLDDTDDDLKIGLGSAVGTTAHMVFDETGAITKPLQPAFLVMAPNQNNVPINSDQAVTFDSEVFDANSDFASSTFTAPVTGKYCFNVSLYLGQMDATSEYYSLGLVTSNKTYDVAFSHWGLANDPYQSINLSVLADMDASDTASVTIYQGGGADQTDIKNNSWFSGFLAT